MHANAHTPKSDVRIANSSASAADYAVLDDLEISETLSRIRDRIDFARISYTHISVATGYSVDEIARLLQPTDKISDCAAAAIRTIDEAVYELCLDQFQQLYEATFCACGIRRQSLFIESITAESEKAWREAHAICESIEYISVLADRLLSDTEPSSTIDEIKNETKSLTKFNKIKNRALYCRIERFTNVVLNFSAARRARAAKADFWRAYIKLRETTDDIMRTCKHNRDFYGIMSSM